MDDARRRLGRRSRGWWRTATGRGRTRAEAVHALVGTIAALTARIEGEDHGSPPMPEREDVLVDQFAVVAYDLLLAGGDAAAVEAIRATLDEVDPR